MTIKSRFSLRKIIKKILFMFDETTQGPEAPKEETQETNTEETSKETTEENKEEGVAGSDAPAPEEGSDNSEDGDA